MTAAENATEMVNVASRWVDIKKMNPGFLKALQRESPGTWIKVYEAGYINGKRVEVHYFINKQTGVYFDSKIKLVDGNWGWSEQFSKGGNGIK